MKECQGRDWGGVLSHLLSRLDETESHITPGTCSQWCEGVLHKLAKAVKRRVANKRVKGLALPTHFPQNSLKVKVTQSCATLCDPTDYTVHGILQARVLEWVAFPFSRVPSQAKDQAQVSHITGRFFTSWATRETQEYWSGKPNPSPADLPDPGIEPGSPALQVDSLPSELSGKPQNSLRCHEKHGGKSEQPWILILPNPHLLQCYLRTVTIDFPFLCKGANGIFQKIYKNNS